MSDQDLLIARDWFLLQRNYNSAVETQRALILANQYDAELTRRNEARKP